MMTKRLLSTVLSSLILCSCSGSAKRVRISNRDKQTKIGKVFKKFGNAIKENPGKFALYVALATTFSGVLYGLTDFFADDDEVFKKICDQFKKKHNFGNNPIALMKALVGELHGIKGKTYSMSMTAWRRVFDFLLLRGAKTRQRKSAERILYNGKAEGYGSCWELANIVDWFCRKLEFERHNIIAYEIEPYIYHTFNFFVYNGNAYLADPLGGFLKKMDAEDFSVNACIGEYINSKETYDGARSRDWYVIEQIDEDTLLPLGLRKWALFFPRRTDNSATFFNRELSNKFDSNDFTSFLKTNGNSSTLVFNDEENIKYNIYPGLLFG